MITYIKKITALTLLVFLCVTVFSSCGKKASEPVQLKSRNDRSTACITLEGYGTIRITLFDENAPKAVAAFKEAAAAGIYNGGSVKNIIEDYCLLLSAADGEYEYSDLSGEVGTDYYPLCHTLCLTETAEGISLNQLMLVTADSAFMDELKELLAYRKITPAEYFSAAYGTELDEDTLEMFYTYGGAPWLYGHCVVLGAVDDDSDSMDILNALSEAELSEDSSYEPLEDIIIETVVVE